MDSNLVLEDVAQPLSKGLIGLTLTSKSPSFCTTFAQLRRLCFQIRGYVTVSESSAIHYYIKRLLTTITVQSKSDVPLSSIDDSVAVTQKHSGDEQL